MSVIAYGSLDHWDMRTGRNPTRPTAAAGSSLDHWDMRTGRNLLSTPNRCARV